MAKYFEEPSRTFSEYLLIPGYTDENCIPANVSLKTPLVKYARGEEPAISLNIPLVSAIMQSVSNDTLAIALAREGGMSFIYGSQSVENEAAMVRRVKNYKAGFVVSDSNLTPDNTLADVLELVRVKGHNTIAVTHDGSSFGKLLGIVTSRDYRVSRMPLETPVKEFMTPLEKLITAPASTGLAEANDIIWEHKLNSIPILSEEGNLMYMVFRKDYAQHKENPLELLDGHKRYMVGAGINTLDYEKRIPALIDAGVDVLCIDSSEGYSIWQKRTLEFIRKNYGDSVKVGAGNVVDRDGFMVPCRVRRGFRQGRHRRRFHLHNPRAEGYRPRTGERSHRSRRSQKRVLRKDGHIYPHLLGRRHRARLSHDPRPRDGRGLPHAGQIFRPLRREPHGQTQHQRQLRQRVLG